MMENINFSGKMTCTILFRLLIYKDNIIVLVFFVIFNV